MFGVFNPRLFNVANNPTREQAEQALFKLDELLSEFAFNPTTKPPHYAQYLLPPSGNPCV